MNNILLGDCIDQLKTLEPNSVDAIVTDPPYGLSFMGKKWDYDVPSVEIWKECYRVLKPGGYLLSFAGTRTQHRMAINIEDAGFEIRDMIAWVYGSGFPKSLNIGKVMDKFLKTGNASWNGTGDSSNGALGYAKLQHNQGYRPNDYSNAHQNKSEITEELAKQWEGWGTALKPALEPITVARKPLSEKNVAENVLKWGTGGINIDGSRVGTEDTRQLTGGAPENSGWGTKAGAVAGSELGRFPANLIHDGSDEVVSLFPDSKAGKNKEEKGTGGIWNKGTNLPIGPEYGDNGSAARFFYCAKASKADRDEGLGDMAKKMVMSKLNASNGKGERLDGGKISVAKNNHPTVKPTKLMQYLVKLVTPKGGVVLDPFMGSGSTGKACKLEGFDFIGIEREPEYVEIAKARIEAVQPTLL